MGFRKLIFFVILSCVLLLLCTESWSQEGEAPRTYNLDGDNVLIEVDDNGARHFLADGNVVLTYYIGEDLWTLNAGRIEFVESLNEDGELSQRIAYAENDLVLVGPGITLRAPGRMEVDVANRTVKSESEEIYLEFEGGSLTTQKVDIHEEIFENGDRATIIVTDVSTVATYNLAESDMFGESERRESTGSIFSDLTFDFAQITIETAYTILAIVDGKPAWFDCLDPTVITSENNTLVMPSCGLTFDPPTLVTDTGVQLQIGEDIEVAADWLTLEYPLSGGMSVEFIGLCAIDPYNAEPDQRVTINHPAGMFSADRLTITVNEDGTHRVHATGCASFEIPLEGLTESDSQIDGLLPNASG